MQCYRLLAVISTILVFASTPASSFAVAPNETTTSGADKRSVLHTDAHTNILMDTATGQVLNVRGTTPGRRSLQRSDAPKNILMATATGQVLNVTGTRPVRRCHNNSR